MADEKGFCIFSYPTNLVIATTSIASFFSFLAIGKKSMWLDETCSVFFAKMDWGDFWAVLSARELNQGLYYFLLKFWLIIGDSEFAIRTLSALFAIASIPVLYALANRLFEVRAGLVSVLLLSVNAFFIQFAQEARGYSLVLFLVVLSSYFFVRVTEDPSNRRMFYGYVCISALAVYAHFFGVLVLIAQTLSVPFLPSDKFRFRRLVLANLLIAGLLTPIFLFIVFKDRGQISWIMKPSVSELIGLFRALAGDAGLSGYITGFYLLPCLITLAHALVTLFRTGRSIDTWRYVLIYFWLVVPICLSYGFSFIKPVFHNTYLIVSLPGLVLLSGVGVSLIKDKYCHGILFALLMVLSIRSTVTEYYPKGKENFRDSAFYVISHAERGDGILFYNEYIIIPFEYYWRRLNPPQDLLDSIYPSKFGHFNYLEDFRPLSVLHFESLKNRYQRIWVVLRSKSLKDSYNLLLTTFEEHYRIQKEKNYQSVHVLLFVKK